MGRLFFTPKSSSMTGWTLATLILMASVGFVLLPAHGQEGEGDESVPLETLLPADTPLLITFPDLGTAREKWKNTALYKIWTDQEVSFAVEKLLGNFEGFQTKLHEDFKEATGVDLDGALDILKGQVSLAILAFPNRENDTPLPRAAFALDFGVRRAELTKLIEFLKEMFKGGRSEGPQDGAVKILDQDVFTFGDEDFRVHYTFLGRTVLIATDKDTMEGLLKSRGGDGSGTLARSEAFQAVRKATVRKGDEALFVYADFGAAVKGLSEFAGLDKEMLEKSLSSAGVSNLRHIGLSVTFTDGGISDALYIHAPGDKKGILRMLSPDKTATPHENLVPADAVSYVALNVDFARNWDLTLSMVKSFDEEAHEEIQKEIAEFGKRTGVNIRDDLIGALDREVSMYSAFPPGGGVLPESVTVLTLKHADRFEEAYRKLMEFAGMERKELRFNGRNMRYFVPRQDDPNAPPPDKDRGGMGSPVPGVDMDMLVLFSLTPFMNYFIEGKHLFISNLMQTLKQEVTKIDGETRFVSLAQNPHYRRLRQKLPGDPGLVFYADMRGIFNLFYNTVLPFSQFAEIFLRKELGVPFENALLPRAEAFAQHLTPSITGVSSLKDGIIVSSYSTTGLTTIGLSAMVMAGAATAVFFTVGDKNSESVRAAGRAGLETGALATLKNISTSQEMLRASVCVDQDGNGAGEYGFFQELAGTANFRGSKESCKDSPYLPKSWGYVDGQGRLYNKGYYFKIYLPGKEKAISTGVSLPEPDKTLAGLQEQRYCVYAWPVNAGPSSNRSFFIDQTGVIYQTYCDKLFYQGEILPKAGAAYDSQGINPGNLDAVPAGSKAGLQAGDGNVWTPLD